MAEKNSEDYRLLCEKLINETWSTAEKFTEQIEEALDKEEWDEKDKSLIILAAMAFLQRATFEKVDSIELFGVDLYNLSPCGYRKKEDCPCDRNPCFLEA